MQYLVLQTDIQTLEFIDSIRKKHCLYPANIRLDEEVLKTPFVFVFKRRLQDVLMKTNISLLTLRLQKTSSRRLVQDQYIRLVHMSSRPLQDVFKTSCQNVFKTSWRRLAKASSRLLQNVFKTCRKYVLKTISRRFEDVSSK